MTSYCFMRFCKVLCQAWNHWRPEDLSWDQIGTQCYALDPDIVLTTCLHLTPYMYMHCSSGFSRDFIRRCRLGSSFPSRIAKHGGLPSIFEHTFICPHILKHIPRKKTILPPFYPFRSWLYRLYPITRWINPIRSWTRSHFPSHGWQPAQLQLRLSSRLNVRCPYAGDDLEPKQLIRLGVEENMRTSSLPMFLECFWGSKMDKVHLWNGGHDDFMVSLWVFFPILKQLFLFHVLLTLCHVKSQWFALFQVALGPAMRAIWPAINCSARSRKSMIYHDIPVIEL